jgi:hypothetical protein
MILPQRNILLSTVTSASILFINSQEVTAKLRGDRTANSTFPPDETELSAKPHRETRILQDLPPGCDPPNPDWIGDGWCDQDASYNSAVCGYDGGDCCTATCDALNLLHHCTQPFDCKDPAASPFTIIFVSDVENKYRGHSVGRSDFIISYIKDLATKGIYFDGAYAGNKVDPQLVIHGGDISHMWSCENFWGCRSPDDEFDDIWDQLYDSGIPMISGFGNHDWAPVTGMNEYLWKGDGDKTDKTNKINRQSSSFVQKSYEKAKDTSNGALTYTEFPPSGDIGQSMYKANFRGLQIGHLGCASSWESYNTNDDSVFSSEEQLDQLDGNLDRNAKTIFFSHYPVHSLEQTDEDRLKDLVLQFSGAHHFSGHVHTAKKNTYPKHGTKTFTDYIAPYPHIWSDDKPGVYAILASAAGGVLQVKTIEINGWENGRICALGTTCKYCDAGKAEYWESKAFTACGTEPCWENGAQCGAGTTCTSCCNSYEFWESKAFTACGTEPCWENGAQCGAGTTCTSCCNSYEFWESKAFTACGTEPCWGAGAICGAGTTCTSCCSDANCPWYQFGICTCG